MTDTLQKVKSKTPLALNDEKPALCRIEESQQQILEKAALALQHRALQFLCKCIPVGLLAIAMSIGDRWPRHMVCQICMALVFYESRMTI